MDKNNGKAIAKTVYSVPAEAGELVYMTSGPQPEQQVEIKRLWSVFRRRWRLMLITFVAVLAVGAAFTFLKKPVYEATAMVMVVTTPPVSGSSGDLRIINDLLALTRSSSVQSHVQLLTSPEVIATAAGRIDPEDIEEGFGTGIVPRWAVKVRTAARDADVISVSGRAYDADIAATLANNLVRAYIERDLAFSSEATRQGREYVSTELDSVQKQLGDARQELAEYKSKTRLVVPESQLRAVADNVVRLESELDKAGVELASVENQARSLGERIVAEGDEVQQSSTIQLNPQYQAALTRVNELNAKRASLIQEYTPESKEIQKVDAEIASAEAQMKQIAETVVAAKVQSRNPAMDNYVGAVVNSEAVKAKVNALQSVLAERSKEMDDLPNQERDLAKLMQRVTMLDHRYQQLSEKYYALLVNEKSTLPNARLASMAFPQPRPASPNLLINSILFFVLAMVFSLAAAAVAERLDGRVKEEDLVSHLLGEVPLSIIPNLPGVNDGKLTIGDVSADSPFAESFRILRNAIYLPSEEEAPKVLAITSPGRGEGKTTTSVNLAIAMGMAGKKVLLVDCDLRRPLLRKRMGISRKIGLTDLVNGKVSIDEAIVATNAANVFCLPSGAFPDNPAEFLGSPESRDIINLLSEKFDVVILDCPPCAGLSDMQMVSKVVDGVLLVVSVNRTVRAGLEDTVQTLSRVNAPIIGHVVNRLNMTHRGYEYYGRRDDDTSDNGDVGPKMIGE